MIKPLFSLLIFTISIVTVTDAQAERFPDFTELVEELQPTVVSIKVDIKKRGRTIGKAGGSGFVVDESGYILTNHHVVDNSDRVLVKLSNGREYEAEVIGSDQGSDVALLKIDGKGLNLKSAKLGSSEGLKVGEWVLAFGAPFSLEQTVTAGIVSAKGRGGVGSQFIPFIQTDVAINSGNSGGPLINLDGEVVGINSMIFNPMISTGLSFAIPIDLAESISSQLKDKGHVVRGYLGVGYEEVDQDAVDALELPQMGGALINNVQPGSPAAEAGIRHGDVIINIEGNKIKQHQDLPFYIAQIKPGKKITMKGYRDGKLRTYKTTLVARQGFLNGDAEEVEASDIGVEVQQLTDNLKEQTGIDDGVMVTDVEAGSPAQRAGIKKGDVIREINRQAIDNIGDFNRALRKFKSAKKLFILISRVGGGSDYLMLDLR